MPGTGFEINWIDRVPVVSTPAQVDLTNAGDLREAMRACMDAGYATLVVDMSETTFCDSAGMKQIVQANRRAVAAGGEVRLVVSDAAVLRILAIIGVDRIMPIFTDLDEAVAEESAPSRPI